MVWVGVGLLALVVVGVIVYVSMSRQVRAWEERIERRGELLMCWIVSAEDSLYEVYDVPGFANARVVFSPDAPPDLKKQLKEAARRLKKGDLFDPDVDPDKIDPFFDKVKAQKWLNPPLRVPKWLVGDFKVYTSIVQVYWRRLPEMHLTRSYLYCWVLFDDNGGVVMGDDTDDEE